MRAFKLALMVFLLPVPSAWAADTVLSVHVSRLTLAATRKMADAAIAACEKAGYQVSVTVVDRNGVTQIAERDTLAPPLSLKISFDKAYTSAMFDAKGSVLQKQDKRVALARLGEHLAFTAGAVPIEAGGIFYGAIGVSGTPEGLLDEHCAEEGLKAVHEDLEMQ